MKNRAPAPIQITAEQILIDAKSRQERAPPAPEVRISDQAELAEFRMRKRKEFEDADAMRDAQRKMAWFALYGMLLYPAMVVLCVVFGIDQASKTLGDMAPTYFVSVAAIVAAFYGKSALENKK